MPVKSVYIKIAKSTLGKYFYANFLFSVIHGITVGMLKSDSCRRFSLLGASYGSRSKQTHGVCENSTENENKIIGLRAVTTLESVEVSLLIWSSCKVRNSIFALTAYFETHDKICSAIRIYISRRSISSIWTLINTRGEYFGQKEREREDVMGGWRKVRNEDLYHL
jgi:hypothetical protein